MYWDNYKKVYKEESYILINKGNVFNIQLEEEKLYKVDINILALSYYKRV